MAQNMLLTSLYCDYSRTSLNDGDTFWKMRR